MSDSGNEDEIMDMSVATPSSPAEFIPFTKAERIQQLSDIDKSITQLLKSAGLAVKTLTTCKEPSASLEDHQQAFTTSAESYLDALHSVDVRMKRQIDGLKESGIVAKRKSDEGKMDGPSGFSGPNSSRNTAAVTLDVGWLNSRSGKVAMDMEAELWAKTRAFLEAIKQKEIEKSSGHASQVGRTADDDDDVDMKQ